MAVTARKKTTPAQLPAPARRARQTSATKAATAMPKPAPTPAPAKAVKPARAEKPKKPKLVRDSFTIPKGEYKALQDSKERATALGRPVKKSELLRAGLMALAAMSDSAFVAALGAVPALKTGRPAKAGGAGAS